jgi:hypothetical protein
MKYNKDYGTSTLKKYVCHEHVEEGKKCDLLLLKKYQRAVQMHY